MDIKVYLKQRHDEALKKLSLAAKNKLPNGRSSQIESLIGEKVGVSGQTVRNYLNGKSNDGFTTEALTKAFKEFKINK